MEHLIINLIHFTGNFGYAILFLIIFFESFPPTLFLPGDSLLFTTGFLASEGYLNIFLLVGTFFIGSVLGYFFSYVMGEKIRNFILKSNDKYWFKKKHLEYTEEFFKKYGIKTVILGRFVPIVRSFGPTLAGAVDMNHRKFIKYTLIGGFLWTAGVTNIGFYLGKTIPNAEKFLTPIVLLIIFISFLPTLREYILVKIEKKKKKL